MKTLLKYMFICVLGLGFTSAYAQNQDQNTKAKEEKFVALIDSKEFTFVATSAQPINASEINQVIGQMQGMASGASINLSEQGYMVSLTKANLISHLPYYGRSFSAPIGNSDSAGFKFNSQEFDVVKKDGKKGAINITVTPKDQTESVRMHFNIAKTGITSLTVSSNKRQSITYTGYIQAN